jgi:hypothetical protein
VSRLKTAKDSQFPHTDRRSDDPWNQTAADNAEWLQRFKRSVGILSAEDGPGLPLGTLNWNVSGGGSGFAPPYAFPKAQLAPFSGTLPVQVEMTDGDNPKSFAFDTEPETVNKFLKSFQTRYPAPATVFCSRELEKGLVEFVEAEGALPSDEALRARAREILGTSSTAADDDVLLGKFKEMVKAKAVEMQPSIQEQTIPEATMMDTNLDEFLQDMNFEFDMDLSGGGASLI